MTLTSESEALTGRVWRLAHRMLLREGVSEDHAMAVADVIRFEVEKELPAIEAAAEARSLPTVEALAEVARIMRQHTHWRQYAMTRQAGPDPEHDCHLCRALVKAGILTQDEIGAGTRAALAATPTPAPEADRG